MRRRRQDGRAGPTDIGFAGIDVRAESSVIFGRRLRNLRSRRATRPATGRSTSTATTSPGRELAADQERRQRADHRAAEEARAARGRDGPGGAAVPQPARKELPALDVTADSYVSKGRDLGRLELKARPQAPNG
jgi:uncharacterized protein YhdP